jgi:molybdate transport system ATP-binding protein
MSLAFAVRARRGGFTLDVAFRTSARSLAVVGPSGAGKTTLLHAIAGLAPGEVSVALDDRLLVDTAAGLSPPAHRRRIGYVFQDGRLFPHLRVGANVGFSAPHVEDPLSVADALRLVDLEGFETRWPASLSGGEVRRVAIARALASRPRLLLLDEPFTGLDAARREALTPYLLRLRDVVAVPMIIVSHDPRDIETLALDVLTLDRGTVRPGD